MDHTSVSQPLSVGNIAGFRVVLFNVLHKRIKCICKQRPYIAQPPFDGFILPGTFNCCLSRNLEYFYCFVVTASARPETASVPVYSWQKLLVEKMFSGSFYKVRTNCDGRKALLNPSLTSFVLSVP